MLKKHLHQIIYYLGGAAAVVLLLLVAQAAVSQNSGGYQLKDNFNYEKMWTEVDADLNKGLPKSALEKIKKLRSLAEKNGNSAMILKSSLYKLRCMAMTEEETTVTIYNEIVTEINQSKFPAKNILHSMLADQLWGYYNQNRWKFLNRTPGAELKDNDITTWDLNKIVEQAVYHYKESLKESTDLQKTALKAFEPILYSGNTRHLRPTLYDFLVHRAIDFFANSQNNLTKPAATFYIDDTAFYSEAAKFSAIKFYSAKDSLSFDLIALNLLQQAIAFHLEDKDPAALIDADLKRLKFVHQNCVLAENHDLYEKALLSLQNQYANSAVKAEIGYDLAQFYADLAATYKPEVNEKYRWHYQKALEIANNHAGEKGFGANNCRALADEIISPSISFQPEKYIPVNQPSLALVNYKNIKKVYFRAVKIDRTDLTNFNYNNTEERLKKLLTQTPVKRWNSDLPSTGDYQMHSAEVKIEALPAGLYILLSSSDADFDQRKAVVSSMVINSTSLAMISRQNPTKGTLEIFALNRITGGPEAKTQVQLYYQEYDQNMHRYIDRTGKTFLTGDNGKVTLSLDKAQKNNFRVELSKKEDILYPEDYLYLNNPYNYNTTNTRSFYFTDRAIYRPGQSVQFKGLLVSYDNQDGHKTKTLPNQAVTVTLYDANYQKVSDLQLKSNDFGTYSGSFILPQGSLNGNFRISDNYGSVDFSVEDYKRPKFKVDFLPSTEAYRLNETVKTKGSATAYAGFAIDQAEVKYRVVRQTYFPYSWYFYGYYPQTQQTEIVNGVTKTLPDGTFEVNFKAIPDLSIDKEKQPAFIYTVYADVTDQNGETRSSSHSFNVGYTALKYAISIADVIDKSEKNYSCTIQTLSLAGEPIEAGGEIIIYRLKPQERILKRRLWSKPDQFIYSEKEFIAQFPNDQYNDELNYLKREREKVVLQTSFTDKDSKSYEWQDFIQWHTGEYLMEVKGKDKYGSDVKEMKYFRVIKSREKETASGLQDFSLGLKVNVQPGEEASILFGSTQKDLSVLFEVEKMGEITQSDFVKLSNEQKIFTLPVTENERGNFSAALTYIKNNRIYKHNFNIIVPWSNKQLDVKFSTFRNKLLPGQNEEWKIKITGPDKEAAAAEMAAVLYDASLDAFRPHGWYLSLFPSRYQQTYFSHSTIETIAHGWQTGEYLRKYYPYEKSYDHLNFWGFNLYAQHFYGGRGGGKMKGRMMLSEGYAEESADMMMSAAPAMMEQSKSTGMAKEAKADIVADKKSENESGMATNGLTTTPQTSGKTPEQVAPRTNLNETAFFYPHLLADDNGDISIKFTVPEALTKWKMLGIAQTRDLQIGNITNELVTQKDLMVTPNLPRFFRENDTIFVSTKVVNLSENSLSGYALLTLKTADGSQNLDKLFENQQNKKEFTATKGQSALVTWKLFVPELTEPVTVTITAAAGNFSDGEETLLPILKNRMLVTETFPLPVKSLQEKKFSWDKFKKGNESKTLKNHSFTLEFTGNPAWYAVQALPYLMEYPYECNEQVFNRFYANSLAQHIVNANPKIQKIFKAWELSGNKETLLSNLEKNQELKSLLLEETPWVMDAKNESERKKRVALLFDLNLMSNNLSSALKKLKERQLPSGGWSWFPGMREDRYITQYIVTGLARLSILKVKNSQQSEIDQMVKKAIEYLDYQVKEDYDRLVRDKANLKDQHIWQTHIFYLYAHSNYQNLKVPKECKTAFDYYYGQSKTYWLTFNKYMEGMIALAANRYGDGKVAKDILKSVKEHALYSEEMGMYWKESYGYSWYQAPIETHALLIEAFKEITKDAEAIDGMKTWLLKSKQTQEWKTTKATADACFALLLEGDDWLKENKAPDIWLGDTKIDQSKLENSPEAGTGYFKTSWQGSDIKADMGEIKIKNNNKLPAWGAVYWQYFENLDKITSAETPLKLKKQLYIERPSDKGPVLVLLEKNTAKIGDRIKVRIELRVDRDMEYVHMKDMRASGFEPENVMSGYRWQGGLGYYESTRDAATNFFFDYLPKGTYVFEYPVRVAQAGDFSNGITSIQCMYAPEFSSHSEGVRVKMVAK